ncbi:MAG: GAF domain-containing sensor histidine kinase [Anaerolineales bacterium]
MDVNSRRRVMTMLIGYRWLSLLPPLVFLVVDQPPSILHVSILLTMIALNTIVSVFSRPLNRVLLRIPYLLGLELAAMAALLALTNGPRSPYGLLALAPLLAGAFFFQLRGALLATTAFVPLYVGAQLLLVEPGATAWDAVWLQVAGLYVMATTFGYASLLLAQLRQTRDVTAQAHRDLEVIHDLTLSLQNAADVNEVEERVLQAVTSDLGYKRAVVGLVDQNEGVVTAWLGRARDGHAFLGGGLPHPARVPITREAGLISQSLLDGRVQLNAAPPLTTNEYISAHLGMQSCHVFPLQLRDHVVGVLLVNADGDGNDPARLRSLKSITSQAAVAVGTTMLCIDRAQRLAVQDERIRIAHEIHDTVSQSLFGMSYALNACSRMLPTKPDKVQTELTRLADLAESARAQLRQSIMDLWPSQITTESFSRDLKKYVHEHCQGDPPKLGLTLNGDFKRLSAGARRSLYRIAQEAVANITQHAAARWASICLSIGEDEVTLKIRDDGRGFEPKLALARERNREHFGLHGIVERAEAFGGKCEFSSRPGAGSTVLVTIPI